MKEIRSYLLSLFLLCFILFFFTGCEDKKEPKSLPSVENTTEILIQKDKKQPNEKKEEFDTEKIRQTDNRTKAVAKQTSANTFTLTDSKQNEHLLSMYDQKINFHDINRSIVVVNFFTTWYSPCRGEVPYLSDIQKKYKKNVFVMGILVNDILDNHALEEFMHKYHAEYFISNSKQNDAFATKAVKALQLPENFPIPLTVIYKEGKYYTHYEGAVPIEMLEHDLQEAIKHKGL